jgi:hypothetical protein
MRPLLFATTLLLSACARKSDLYETLAWMDNTYNPHENISGAYGHGWAAWYTHDGVGSKIEVMASGQAETFTFEGCDLTLKVEDDKRANTATEMYGTSMYHFTLRDIDPSSVKIETASHLGGFPCAGHTPEELAALAMDCDHAVMTFSTRSAAGLISEERHSIFPKLTGADHDSTHSSKANSAYFVFNDVEYAPRFARAFAHAVQFCGGKASSF